MIDDSNSFVHNVFFRINKRFKSQSIHEIILLLFKKDYLTYFRPVGPNHGGASLVTEPQPPQSQKCGYGPVKGLNISTSAIRKASVSVY